MDILLSKVTQQAMNYAIRSGITITSGYAISQCSRLLKTKHGRERDELGNLQRRLDSKIRIISPAIDMIELITARGNTSLESAVTLTKALRWDIQALGVRLSNAAADEELSRKGSSKSKTKAQKDIELKFIISDMRALLERIEDAVPLISLAITTSGVSLSTNLPASISPSRLLQASTFLSAGDAHYAMDPCKATQIGPAFTLSMYMLFSGHANRAHDEEGLRNTIWQEVIHKARVKLLRTALDRVSDLPGASKAEIVRSHGAIDDEDQLPKAIPAAARTDEFAYQLLFVEDLDDNRVHTLDDDSTQPTAFEDVATAGIREAVPIHQVSKIFYADTGKILNIGSEGETNNPVLLLKRDITAAPPRRMMDQDASNLAWEADDVYESIERQHGGSRLFAEDIELDAQFARDASRPPHTKSPIQAPHRLETWGLPPGLDPEWIALEVYNEETDSDDEADATEDEDDRPSQKPTQSSRQNSIDPALTSALSNLRLGSSRSTTPSQPLGSGQVITVPSDSSLAERERMSLPLGAGAPIRTSLSLLEMLVRLTSLQQFQQASHLTINDELLNFFLEESSTTGAAPGDVEARKRIRLAARQRVGFDPYDESPVKRRGEDYQYRRDDKANEGWSDLQDVQHFRENTTTLSSQSPLLLRSRDFATPSGTAAPPMSTRRRSSTPVRVTPLLPGTSRSCQSLATPPDTTKSRQAFLRDETLKSMRSSPLTSSISGSFESTASGEGLNALEGDRDEHHL